MNVRLHNFMGFVVFTIREPASRSSFVPPEGDGSAHVGRDLASKEFQARGAA